MGHGSAVSETPMATQSETDDKAQTHAEGNSSFPAFGMFYDEPT